MQVAFLALLRRFQSPLVHQSRQFPISPRTPESQRRSLGVRRFIGAFAASGQPPCKRSANQGPRTPMNRPENQSADESTHSQIGPSIFSCGRRAVRVREPGGYCIGFVASRAVAFRAVLSKLAHLRHGGGTGFSRPHATASKLAHSTSNPGTKKGPGVGEVPPPGTVRGSQRLRARRRTAAPRAKPAKAIVAGSGTGAKLSTLPEPPLMIAVLPRV